MNNIRTLFVSGLIFAGAFAYSVIYEKSSLMAEPSPRCLKEESSDERRNYWIDDESAVVYNIRGKYLLSVSTNLLSSVYTKDSYRGIRSKKNDDLSTNKIDVYDVDILSMSFKFSTGQPLSWRLDEKEFLFRCKNRALKEDFTVLVNINGNYKQYDNDYKEYDYWERGIKELKDAMNLKNSLGVKENIHVEKDLDIMAFSLFEDSNTAYFRFLGDDETPFAFDIRCFFASSGACFGRFFWLNFPVSGFISFRYDRAVGMRAVFQKLLTVVKIEERKDG